MSRFFVPKEFVKADSIYITGLEAHHILDVMRLKVSDEVVVFDGTGREYTGIVKKADRKSLEVRIKSAREGSVGRGLLITLIQAIPKKAKMDYIVEKATELGVRRIIPVTTERTIPEWNDAKKAGIADRWRKIAREAAKQCGRSDIPEVEPITEFKEAIVAGVCDLKLIAALSDKAVKLKEALKNSIGKRIAVAIGPEGDFTPEETESALKASFKIVSLGPRVLKSDTAGLAALSMINYEREN
ncbi:MAG: 16S rRNA (uracil(1498)-N(3))-methyltransferase [Candidatus Omnitrophota bacterium]|nr:16S rRNA (uracil(1498)-N(3))-methyltransferase [Candidatus Omnitrophota bacterium]